MPKKHRKLCTALDIFLVFEDRCPPFLRIVAFVWSSFCTGPWHHQSCHALNSSSHADTSSAMPCPSTSAMPSPNNNAARGINGPGCTVVTLLVKVQHLMFSSHGTRHTQCSTDGGKDGRSQVPQKPYQSSFVLVAHSCSSLKGLKGLKG